MCDAASGDPHVLQKTARPERSAQRSGLFAFAEWLPEFQTMVVHRARRGASQASCTPPSVVPAVFYSCGADSIGWGTVLPAVGGVSRRSMTDLTPGTLLMAIKMPSSSPAGILP
jgi:hypothetical protein